MDDFDIVRCALWSDHFMSLHQRDTTRAVFRVGTILADDFLLFLAQVLDEEKTGYFINAEKLFLSVELTPQEVEQITDWILDFNFSIRKPSGLVMPDLYLDEEKIRATTVNVYCHFIEDVIAYMLKHESAGRDKLAKWAAENFMLFYAQAYGAAIKAKTPSG